MRAALTLTRDSGNVQHNPTQNHESCEVLYTVLYLDLQMTKKGRTLNRCLYFLSDHNYTMNEVLFQFIYKYKYRSTPGDQLFVIGKKQTTVWAGMYYSCVSSVCCVI